MTLGDNMKHGFAASIAAIALPDSWLSFGGRVAAAIFFAALSTLASKVVSLLWKKAGFK